MSRILIVDDDEEMRHVLMRYLQQQGYLAFGASTESEIVQRMNEGRIDLILLDINLGSENGLEICVNLRAQQNVPIIFVSAYSDDHERMAGYEAGADDYIAKPFNPELLIARVKAVISRARRSASLIYRRNTNSYYFNRWCYNAKKDEVLSPEGVQVYLSKRETALLQIFVANPHIPLTREEIADSLGDGSAPHAPGRAIDVLVARLRSKIEADPKSPDLIKTKRGSGYVFSADVVEQLD
jgi:two-component system OmpR family response regulator